jgi:hypothetical protein
MLLKYKRYVLFCFLAFCLSITHAQSQDITSTLNTLKAANNLQEWLYMRMDHTAANPQRNLHFFNGDPKRDVATAQNTRRAIGLDAAIK